MSPAIAPSTQSQTGETTEALRLELVDLACERGDRRLFEHLHFRVGGGTLLHVQGPNGSGKTTLLRVLCGLMLPQEGEVRWGGENIRALREEYAKEVLYFGHLNGIKSDLTGLENLRIAATLDGDEVSEKEVWRALEETGLVGFEDLPIKVLSQGQKKRVALARLQLSQARLWVLDEPFTALDVKAVARLEALIAQHVAQGGIAVITTHQEVALTSGTIERLTLGN